VESSVSYWRPEAVNQERTAAIKKISLVRTGRMLSLQTFTGQIMQPPQLWFNSYKRRLNVVTAGQLSSVESSVSYWRPEAVNQERTAAISPKKLRTQDRQACKVETKE
jgi:hypothetical protein